MYTHDRAAKEALAIAYAIGEEIGRAQYYFDKGEFDLTKKQIAALETLRAAEREAIAAFAN